MIALLAQLAAATDIRVPTDQPTLALAYAAATSVADPVIVVESDLPAEPPVVVDIDLDVIAGAGSFALTSSDPGLGVFRIRGGDVAVRGLVLDGAGGRVVTVEAGSLTLDRLTIRNADGPVYADTVGGLRVVGTTFAPPALGSSAPAIEMIDGDLDVATSTFEGYRSDRNGGCVRFESANDDLTVVTSHFTECAADGGDHGGGAIHVEDADRVSIETSTFTRNTSVPSKGGGAIYIGHWMTVDIADCRFEENGSQGEGGGAVYLREASLGRADLTRNVFCANTALGNPNRGGGALLVHETAVDVHNCLFGANGANQGGAVLLHGSTADVVIDHSVLSGGSTSATGAAVEVQNGVLRIDDSVILDNEGANAVVYDGGGALSVFSSIYHDNLASDQSGPLDPSTRVVDPLVGAGPDPCDPFAFAPGFGSPLHNASADLVHDLGVYGGPLAMDDGDPDGDGVREELDCDDADPDVHPGATEMPDNAVDEDCDGAWACYVDSDGDGDRQDAVSTGPLNEGCTAPYLAPIGAELDCDDADPLRNHLAAELPGDEIDQDCNSNELCFRDDDHDGVGSDVLIFSTDLSCAGIGESTTATDCDDADPDAFPGAPETAGDGTDQDCDGSDACYADTDGDGVGGALVPALNCAAAGFSLLGGDCDETDVDVHAGAAEVPVDGVDQDCDGTELCYADLDRDGFGEGSPDQPSAGLSCADDGFAPVDGDLCPLGNDLEDADGDSVPDACDPDFVDTGDTGGVEPETAETGVERPETGVDTGATPSETGDDTGLPPAETGDTGEPGDGGDATGGALGDGGCGCAGSGPGSPLVGVGLAALAARRRQRGGGSPG